MLVGHWPLQEDSGDALDHSGNEYHATVSGATQGATGILGTTAFQFDGTNDKVDTASQVTVSNLTLSAWIKTTSQDDFVVDCIDSESTATTGGTFHAYDFYLENDATARARIEIDVGGTTYTTFSTTVVNDGSWHLWTATYDGDNLRMYIDGVEESVDSSMSGAISSPEALVFGGGTTRPYAGSLADVRVYDHALTPSEVSYLYEVSRGGSHLLTDWEAV